MKIWNLFLWPLSVLYGTGTRFRNCLFDWGILKAEHYPVPVICIGNLAVGGTGKTPLTEYLICLLKKHFRIAVVSRGYKRSSRGYLLATLQHSYHDIGDEPYQMRHKFPDILIAIDADRRRAIRNLLSLPEAQRPEVILLDDAFQHRYVSPSFSILLTNYRNMFYQDRLLPLGRLRESESGKQRADVVIVSKTPEDLKPIEYRIAETNMHLMAHQNVFFTYINYGEMLPLFPEAKCPEKGLSPDTDILLLTGIAFPHPFIEEVRKWNHEMQVMSFPDHHDFKEGDIFLHCGNDVHCFKYISPEERLSLLVLQFDPRLIWTHCGEWFNPKYLQLFTGNNLNSRHLSNDTPEAKEIASLMDECFRECCKQQPAYEMIVKAKLLLILSILVRYYYDYFPQNNAEMDSRNINHIERSMDYILRNLSTQLTLQDIANEAHMSRSYYSATFKQLNGVSVWGYITSQRINRAQHLLESTTLPVIEISEYCGYNNIANFNRSFKKITGKTPRVYRKDYLSALAKKGGNNEEESRSPHIAYN